MQPSNAFKLTFLLPKYWNIWLGYGILRLLSFIPYHAKFWFGKQLGKLLFYIAKNRRELARKNIQLCFPEKTAIEVQQILKEHFESLGINLLESGTNIWGKHRYNATRNESEHFTFKGLENLQNQPGLGKILVVPHFTTIEMTGLMVSFITPYRPIYRPHDNALMEYLITTSRTVVNIPNQPNRSVIPVSNKDTRAMVKHLKSGGTLFILPDQKYGGQGFLRVPFFGYDVPSNPGINKLAKMGQAAVYPVFTRRINDKYELTIHPALENFPSGDDYADTLRLHQLYEAEIRENPAQYLWVHDRWDIKNHNPALPESLYH